MGLGKQSHHKPNELRVSEKQRIEIAWALINRPTVLLADRPTGNLDTKTSYEIIDLLTALFKEGNTILLVTHEEDFARSVPGEKLRCSTGVLMLISGIESCNWNFSSSVEFDLKIKLH